MTFNDFREIWLLEIRFDVVPGNRPRPLFLDAKKYRSGDILQLTAGELLRPAPPYSTQPSALTVMYDAPAVLACHLSLNWPVPPNILDLHAEFRCLTSGLLAPGDYDLAEALSYFGVPARGENQLKDLFEAMLPRIDLPRALLRGRYGKAVARIEATGIPIDVDNLTRMRHGWETIQDRLIEEVDRDYEVFDGRKLNRKRWRAWLNRNHISWPRKDNGDLDLTLDAFRDMATTHSIVRPIKQLLATLWQLRPTSLVVGSDGRNRSRLRPFAAKTGRNCPSTSEFIFGPATWMRGLIRPTDGNALAYVDYEQQEFGIAAALSGDRAMQDAYVSGDPYLTFAVQAGAAPPNASKMSHGPIRERFKSCALGVQYGMGAKSLAIRAATEIAEAMALLSLHRETYATYWQWSEAVEAEARRSRKLQSVLGWTLNVEHRFNRRSIRNFPLQANGAEILRLACSFLTEAGLAVCAPVHDALLIEAPAREIEDAVSACQRGMERASKEVLDGFSLRTEAKIIRYPDRYMDARGSKMWLQVMALLEAAEFAHAA